MQAFHDGRGRKRSPIHKTTAVFPQFACGRSSPAAAEPRAGSPRTAGWGDAPRAPPVAPHGPRGRKGSPGGVAGGRSWQHPGPDGGAAGGPALRPTAPTAAGPRAHPEPHGSDRPEPGPFPSATPPPPLLAPARSPGIRGLPHGTAPAPVIRGRHGSDSGSALAAVLPPARPRAPAAPPHRRTRPALAAAAANHRWRGRSRRRARPSQSRPYPRA